MLLRNNALLDGNKRTGWVLCVLFFQLNGCEQRYDEDAQFDLILAVAAGEIEEIGAIARRLAVWFTAPQRDSGRSVSGSGKGSV